MPKGTNPYLPWKMKTGAAEGIIARAEQDLVFSMQFLGESQYALTRHFSKFITAELARHGVNRENHPLLQVFVDTHAAELRDFVFSGTALSRQFRIGEIEALLGDSTNLLRTDIWDQLSNNIASAETQFQAQAKDFPALLAQMEQQAAGQGGP